MVIQKILALIRRYKLKIYDVFIFINGLFLMITYIEKPININRMTTDDWSYVHINGIGDSTIQKIQSNIPFNSIDDLNKISGVGNMKLMQLSHYFTTYDTMRSDVWYTMLIIGAIFFFVFLALRIVCEIHRVIHVKCFENKLFEKKKNTK